MLPVQQTDLHHLFLYESPPDRPVGLEKLDFGPFPSRSAPFLKE